MTTATKPTTKLSADERGGGWKVVAAKELGDHLYSGRFIVLLGILGLATGAAVFAASGGIRDVAQDAENVTALFLKLFTVTTDPVPFPLVLFVSFLAPLLGIMFGFDSINGERAQGTLPRLLSQPIHRDEVILGKFVAGIGVVSIILTALTVLVAGIGIFRLGLTPTLGEFSRLIVWLLFTVVYVAFWQGLATLVSVRTTRAATSALVPVGLWLLFALFWGFVAGAGADIISPADSGMPNAAYENADTQHTLMQLSPITLYQEGSTVLLDPEVRTTGLLTLEQIDQALVTELNIFQSLGVVWPQMVMLLAVTAAMFAIAFVSFMRQEVRA